MDSIHGTEHYHFTVLVLDDFGEGIPVAWLISNKANAIMNIFLLLSFGIVSVVGIYCIYK